MISFPEGTTLITVALLLSFATAQEECQTSTVQCYECDSRYDNYCGDPFNRSLAEEIRPQTRECKGCCVKFLHKYPNEEWVQRTCTENVPMEFPYFHVCMIEGKGHGNLCFCEKDLCNHGITLGSSSTLLFSLVLITVNFMHILQEQLL